MKIFNFVILFVLFSQTMAYKLENIIVKPMTKQKCEKTNCSLMDDPVCVKIKNKNNKEIHVIAKNKCEIIYASCEKDVDAAVVPMVNCQDVQNIKSKRNKREADESRNENFPNDDNQNEDPELLNRQSGDDENEDELVKGQVEDDENENQELYKSQSGDDDNEDQEILKAQSEDDENVDQDLLKGLSEENEGINAVKAPSSSENQNHSELDANNSENSLKKKSALDDLEDKTTSDVDENDIPKMTSVDNVGADYDQSNDDVDLVESQKDCPTVCPSRDVMVCARCHHNIYRTFPSLCHLRMFACKHTNEKLQLVKREPCVQSAPYLSAFKETKGTIRESGQLDDVHKFIFCREKKLLSKDDPRCIVVEEDK